MESENIGGRIYSGKDIAKNCLDQGVVITLDIKNWGRFLDNHHFLFILKIFNKENFMSTAILLHGENRK